MGRDNTILRARNTNLDLMKILACVAVVGLHTLQKDLSVFNSTLYYICSFAVPVFFMASGYILLNRRNISFRYSVMKCWSILRIVVLWAAIVLVGSTCIAFIRGKMETDLLVSFAKLIIKSLVKKGMLWHFWYFGALLLIYICVPLLNKHRERLNRIWIAFFAFGFLAQLGSYIIGTPLQSYCIQTFRLWTWIQYFILGGLCGREWRHPERNVTLKAHTYSVALASAFVVLYQNIVGRFLLHNLYAEYFYDSVFTILWVVVLFTWIMRLNLSLKLNNIIRRLSPLTMGIYIIHPLLIRIGAHFIKIDNILFSLIYFIAILLVSGLLAGILSRIPLMNKLIKL